MREVKNAYVNLKSRLVDLRLKGCVSSDEAMEICVIKILLEEMEFDKRMECNLSE